MPPETTVDTDERHRAVRGYSVPVFDAHPRSGGVGDLRDLVRGLSDRDIEAALAEVLVCRRQALSRSTVSRICAAINGRVRCVVVSTP